MLRRKSLLISLFCYFAAALVATPVFSEPPVPDWRDNEGSTFQEWAFSDDITTPSPEPGTFNNPYATDNDPVLLNVDASHGWYDSIENASGVWALSGQIDIVIPNQPEPNPYKEIWLSLVWKPEVEVVGTPLEPNPFQPDEPWIAVVPFEYMDIYKRYDEVENGWHHTVFVAGIWPNPPKEWITVKGNILVDHLAIDTICVPEPTTIAFITAGAFWAMRRKKRGK